MSCTYDDTKKINSEDLSNTSTKIFTVINVQYVFELFVQLMHDH